MALQITEFSAYQKTSEGQVDLPDGISAVSNPAAGSMTLGSTTRLIRIFGSGTIQWPGIATPEKFDGMEFRGVKPSTILVIG